MSPSAGQDLNPPPSPEVAQQASPEMAQSVFAQQGLDQQQTSGPEMQAQQIMVKLGELNDWAAEMQNLVGTFDPSLMPYLQQIASAAVQFGNGVQQKVQRAGISRGSSVVPPTPPASPGGPPPDPNQT